MTAKRKGSGFGLQPIDRIIGEVLGEGKLGDSSTVAELLGHWKEIVGEDVAKHCFPEKIDGRKLCVRVDSPMWHQQLDLLKEEMKDKIDGVIENSTIEKIVFRSMAPER